MKKLSFVTFVLLCILGLVSFRATAAYAHGGEPRLEISIERVRPGGVVDVRGVDFGPEEIVTLALVNTGGSIPLGEITADVEGIFLQSVTLPVDLPAGTYNFLAVTDDHRVASPNLVVDGAPILGKGGEQAVREEDDPLLAPMPTLAMGFTSTSVAQSNIPSTNANPGAQRNSNLFLPVMALAILGILFFAAQWVRQKK